MSDFTPTSESEPKQEQRVDWIAPDGRQINGGFYHGRLWFLPEQAGQTMYVYYEPVAWRPAQESTP